MTRSRPLCAKLSPAPRMHGHGACVPRRCRCGLVATQQNPDGSPVCPSHAAEHGSRVLVPEARVG